MTTPAQDTTVRSEIVVDAPIERAFDLFTTKFDRIKPREAIAQRQLERRVQQLAIDEGLLRRGLFSASNRGGVRDGSYDAANSA